MQREDVHRSSTTDMPIVESVENVRTGTQINTNFKHNLLNKTMIFSLIFSDLKLGIFHPNIGEKKRFGIGNITV